MVDIGAHWDRVHATQGPTVVPDDDEVGVAGLRHFGDLRGARLLDLGCGNGEYSLYFAARGAQVTAIDVSKVAIASLTASCAEAGIDDVVAIRASAFDVAELGPFDAVFGSMILHHLEPFDAFVDVLAAAMAPGGRGFFYENNAMSKALVWCRRHLVGRFGIPRNSDDEEFPLEPRELGLLARRFTIEVEYPTLYLARMASGYLLRGHGERQLGWIDDLLYPIERIRRLSYRQYVKLTGAT